MDVLRLAGAAALGSRFRRLAERLSTDAAKLYSLYGVEIEPSWFPLMYLLNEQKQASITEISELTGHSHPFVSKTVRQMKAAEMVSAMPAENDKRSSVISLTDKARAFLPQLNAQMADVSSAVERLLSDIDPDFIASLDKLDDALAEHSLLSRVSQIKKQKNVQGFRVTPFLTEHKQAFFEINRAWIEEHFTLEPSDIRSLTSPEKYIIERGGHILLALDSANTVCGSVALIAMPDNTFELAKMAVVPAYKGKGLGVLLGEHAIALARKHGAKRLYLESNRKLMPAISLYRKLGFTELPQRASPYARCDIQMEMRLL